MPRIAALSSLLGLALVTVTPSSGAPAGDEWRAIQHPEEVEAYARALDSLRTSPGRGMRVEEVLEKGFRAAAALVYVEGVLDNLSDVELNTVVDKMEGFIITTVGERVWVAEPDPDFFLTLAQTSGEQADVLFFDAYKRSFPDGLSVVYFQQRTHYSGCISYGSLDLVDLFRRWTRYGQQYPNRYAAQVARRVQEIRVLFTEGRCACSGKESVLTEFRAFVEAFPRASFTPRVRERIGELEAETSSILFMCRGG